MNNLKKTDLHKFVFAFSTLAGSRKEWSTNGKPSNYGGDILCNNVVHKTEFEPKK